MQQVGKSIIIFSFFKRALHTYIVCCHISLFSFIVAAQNCPGSSFKQVVKTTILLQDMSDFVAVNEVYKEYFTENYPARACYQVAALPKGGLIEIEGIAVVGCTSVVQCSM